MPARTKHQGNIPCKWACDEARSLAAAHGLDSHGFSRNWMGQKKITLFWVQALIDLLEEED